MLPDHNIFLSPSPRLNSPLVPLSLTYKESPGYFYAVDKEGNQIRIDPNESIITEKYVKVLDLCLETHRHQLFLQADSDAGEKLEKIF